MQRAAVMCCTLNMSDWGYVVQLYAGGRIDTRLYAALLLLHGGTEAEATDYVGACVRTRCEEVSQPFHRWAEAYGLHAPCRGTLGGDVPTCHGKELISLFFRTPGETRLMF